MKLSELMVPQELLTEEDLFEMSNLKEKRPVLLLRSGLDPLIIGTEIESR